MSALHFLGKVDRPEQSFLINEQQQQALMNVLLQGRDPQLYQMLYGQRHVRDVWQPETRGSPARTWCCRFTIKLYALKKGYGGALTEELPKLHG